MLLGRLQPHAAQTIPVKVENELLGKYVWYRTNSSVNTCGGTSSSLNMCGMERGGWLMSQIKNSVFVFFSFEQVHDT